MADYDWIYQACYLELEIKQLEYIKQDILSSMKTRNQDSAGLPNRRGNDPHAKLDSYLQITEKIDRSLERLNKTKLMILEAIENLSDSRQRYLLRAKYIPNSRGETMTLEQISEKINYSYSQTKRIHAEALGNIAAARVVDTLRASAGASDS